MRVLLKTVMLGYALLAGLAWGQARAEAFVEFRARSGPDLVGHAFIAYGRLDARGRVASADVAGLYTKEQYYFKGIVFPLPGFVGPEKEDLTERSAVIFRRVITDGELRKLRAGVARIRAVQHQWHFLFFNCNDFVGEIAELIGLRRPPSLMLPVTYVAALGTMNGLTRIR
jgi:hypothetical protein